MEKCEKKGVWTTFRNKLWTTSVLMASISQNDEQHSGMVRPWNPILIERLVLGFVSVVVESSSKGIWVDGFDDVVVIVDNSSVFVMLLEIAV